MKSKHFSLFLFYLVIIFLTSACQNIEVGIESTPAPTVELTSKPTPTFVQLATLPSPTKTATPTIESANYVQTAYGFSFQYPISWKVEQEKNTIKLSIKSTSLEIHFKNEKEPISILPDPRPSSALSQTGSVNFLTQTITKNTLLKENTPISTYYNNGSEIKIGSILFTFLLSSDQQDEKIGIAPEIQEQADQIISSFEATFDLTASSCSDMATFVQDVTVLDDTRFSPGEAFTKTWRLLNSGTCTWTPNYALIFLDGDQMTGQSSQRFPSEVAPGEKIDLSIDLTAPASSGTYRGNWMLQNEDGNFYGLGMDGDKPFWVQIIVGETNPDIRESLGEPSFRDTLAGTNNWYLLDTANTKFKSGENSIILTALNPGENDEWGISSIPPLKNFYLEILFTTAEACSGLDRYGVIFRAPEPNQGYVFTISCDGRYRLYIWDGMRYQPIQEWKNSPHIKTGVNQTNRLGVYAIGNTLKLYANGQLLSEYVDDTFSEGRFGVLVGAEQTSGFEVIFDEAAYWKIQE
jgi:hypothetical protein